MPDHNDQHQHQHHNHDLATVHYDVSCHDDYPAHKHEWSGNNYFSTVLEHIDDSHADDYELTTPGDDHFHRGFDIRWADNHSRTGRPANVPTVG